MRRNHQVSLEVLSLLAEKENEPSKLEALQVSSVPFVWVGPLHGGRHGCRVDMAEQIVEEPSQNDA